MTRPVPSFCPPSFSPQARKLVGQTSYTSKVDGDDEFEALERNSCTFYGHSHVRLSQCPRAVETPKPRPLTGTAYSLLSVSQRGLTGLFHPQLSMSGCTVSRDISTCI